MFTSIIHTIISTKFQINPLTVTLFSGSGPKSFRPVADECQNAVGYRVKKVKMAQLLFLKRTWDRVRDLDN